MKHDLHDATSDTDEAEETRAEHPDITMKFPNGNTLTFLKTTLSQPQISGSFFDKSSEKWSSIDELFVEHDYKLFNTFIVPYLRYNLLPDITGETNQTIAHLKKIVDFLSLTEVIKHLENTTNGNENSVLKLTDPDIKDGVATITFFLAAQIKSQKSIEKVELTVDAGITVHGLHLLLCSFNLITRKGQGRGERRGEGHEVIVTHKQTLLWRGENMRGQRQEFTAPIGASYTQRTYDYPYYAYPRDEQLVADMLKGNDNEQIVCFPGFSSPNFSRSPDQV